MMDERQRKQQIIEEVLNLMDGGQKPSEGDTCSKAIERLLRKVSGYDYPDYLVQAQGEGGTYPDYVMLPRTDYTWFLEAKVWRLPLSDSHAGQAVSYANNNGGRWVVLTNGYEWRLYDNAVPTGLQGKLVLTAKLSSPIDEVLEFFHIISKESMMSGHIARVVDKILLKRELDEQLSDRNSVVVKAVVKALKQKGVSNVTAEQVVDYFASKRKVVSSPISPPPPAEVAMTPPNVSAVSPTTIAGGSHSLEELYRHRKLVTGTKPVAIKLPDGSVKSVNHWVILAIEVVRWLAVNQRLPQPPYPPNPPPFQGRFFYNVVNKHPDGRDMHETYQFRHGGVVLYVEVKQSSVDCVKYLYNLCKDSGVDAAQIVITIR